MQLKSVSNVRSKSLQENNWNGLAAELNLNSNRTTPPTPSHTPPAVSTNQNEVDSDSDSDDDGLTHPNKFPVEIEYHGNQYCIYKRQSTRYFKLIVKLFLVS